MVCSAVKNKILLFATKWMEMEGTILRETDRQVSHVLICGSSKQFLTAGERAPGTGKRTGGVGREWKKDFWIYLHKATCMY